MNILILCFGILILASFADVGGCSKSLDECVVTRNRAFCRGKGQIPHSFVKSVKVLRLHHAPSNILEKLGIQNFTHLVSITVIDSERIVIKSDQLSGLQRLGKITFGRIRELHFQTNHFSIPRNLRRLRIVLCNLDKYPKVVPFSNSSRHFKLILKHNAISVIRSNSFSGLNLEYLDLSANRISYLEDFSFNNTRIRELNLAGNEQLTALNPQAFRGCLALLILDISTTQISSLPETGLESVRYLIAENVFTMKNMPLMHALPNLILADLTYPYHCCHIEKYYSERAKRSESIARRECSNQDESELPNFCNTISEQIKLITNHVRCTPQPNALNPCEDIIDHWLLRLLIWIIWILAIIGNMGMIVHTIVAIKLGTDSTTHSSSLVINLAVANLLTGAYLGILAFNDFKTRGEYYNHAVDWQNGPGCKIAGFIAVVSSELSIVSLCLISFELFYNIRHQDIRHHFSEIRCMGVIAVVWLLCGFIASLPIFGVNGYEGTSLCLPISIIGFVDRIYIAAVLLFNGTSFTFMTIIYAKIYRMIWSNKGPARGPQTVIAKRIALIVFTNFLCLAPVVVVGLIAAITQQSIVSIQGAKVLLVVFVPINGVVNPFLYVLMTRRFHVTVSMVRSRYRHSTFRPSELRRGSVQSNTSSASVRNTLSRGSSVLVEYFARKQFGDNVRR